MGDPFARAVYRAKVEQAVEDHNALSKLDNNLNRRCIIMPMNEGFDPPPGSFSRGHIQMGDKMSIPRSIFSHIQREDIGYPWLFEIEVLHSPEEQDELKQKEEEEAAAEAAEKAQREADNKRTEEEEDDEQDEGAGKSGPKRGGARKKKELQRVYGSILDYAAPENYIFAPDWMLKALRLRPRDVVEVRLAALPKGGLIKLRPHSSDFLKLSNHQAVMETELKHYSCLTEGATVKIKYRDTVYELDVEELLSDGKPVGALCIEDTDVATDFLPPLDTLRRRKKQEGGEAAAGDKKKGRRKGGGGRRGGATGKEEEEEEV